MATTTQPAVGSRVVVAGKEALGVATLRFIGTTKFRPGVWAGLEFPSAVGKNDGSVEGTRYFSCPQDHGMFVPAENLIVQQPPEPAATLSSSGGGDPAVGSVVVVAGKEALGAGVLRFCGPTKFRDGVWAGIEYPSAVGKNDGSVEGTRYFSCPPDHGVFVPVKSVIVQACVRLRLLRSGCLELAALTLALCECSAGPNPRPPRDPRLRRHRLLQHHRLPRLRVQELLPSLLPLRSLRKQLPQTRSPSRSGCRLTRCRPRSSISRA